MFHKGKNGKEYANPQLRDHADRQPMPKMERKMPGKENMGNEKAEGDVKSRLEAMHAAMGGTHMHVHQGDDGSLTSHHVGEDGMVEGPHKHADMDALAEHQHGVFDSEGHEPGMQEDEGMPSGNLRHALSGLE